MSLPEKGAGADAGVTLPCRGRQRRPAPLSPPVHPGDNRRSPARS